ncbi:MAG: hypothetical protein JXA54_02405 [Candidatus Heimdallarchaeota archaeon]|nr:hypothetical protein [Candidatus Heimdallarchaeota archaeon]
MKNKILSLKKYSLKRSLTLILMVLSFIVPILISNSPNNFGSAHSAIAIPTEIFSLWNDTAPSLDGAIEFSYNDLSKEWSSAAVYNMFNETNSPSSKLLIQNDNTNLYIGLDMAEYIDANPSTAWGCAVYLDIDHNGILTNADRAVLYMDNSTTTAVSYLRYSETQNKWLHEEFASPGVALSSTNILINSAFTSSEFSATSHRQYEIRIPLAVMQISPGNITGFGIESFDNYNSVAKDSITWPGYSNQPGQIRNTPSGWGDLCIGRDTSKTSYFAQYVVEENTNIKTDAVGMNNGTYLATGDIDGDGDLELIVGSNRTVTGDENLLAIYDYVGGEFNRIWESWETSHQTKMITPLGIATFDFDENGEDEIYICGNDNKILRLYNWNPTAKNFDDVDNAYIHTGNLVGYIAIGDVNKDGKAEIVVGESKLVLNGELLVLTYNSSGTNEFSLLHKVSPGSALGFSTDKVLAIEIADMDEDLINELLIACQITSDDSLGTSALKISEYAFSNIYGDNGQDDLPSASSNSTIDQHIHTILVADVDNDGITETVISGKNYLKVFGKNTFSGSNAPIELLINSTLAPNMGGGVICGDIDSDGANELIIGAANGTIYILNISDSGSDNLSYTIEWQSDLGHSPGKVGAMVVLDLDKDSENELIFGDNYGQIISLGKSQDPSVTIISPSYGSTRTDTTVSVTWSATDDFAMHHFDVFVKGSFVARAGGSQTGIVLRLEEGKSQIIINGFDITGKNDSAITEVTVNLDSPEVFILNPENNAFVGSVPFNLELSYYDKNGDFDYYAIYVNETNQGNTTGPTFQVVLSLGDGIYNITVLAVDEALNTGRETINVIRDTTAPVITITSPLDGSAVRNNEITVQWSASDQLSGINYFKIQKDGVDYTTTSTTSAPVTLGIDKDYSIRVIAYDKAGNSNSDLNIITKDSVKPFVNITSHPDYFITSNTVLNLNWVCYDNYGGTAIDRSEVTVNGISKYSGSLTEAVINLVDEGTKNIIVTTYDFAGNSEQDLITVIVDTAAPIIQIISPVNNYNTSLSYVVVSWESSDTGSGIFQYNIFVDSTLYLTINNPYTTSLAVPIPTDKSYTITVRAIDHLDNLAEDTIVVIRDSSLEEMSITNPVALHSYISNTQFTMNWVVANIENITLFEIYINGSLEYTILDNTSRSQLIDLGSIPFDSYLAFNVTLVAYTTNPLQTFRDICYVHVDQLSPLVNILLPLNNTNIYSNLILVTWDGSDSGSGITKTVIKVGITTIATLYQYKSQQYIVLDDTLGTVTITVEIWDKASNTAKSIVNLQVFLLSPEFTINLQDPFYINTASHQFDLSVTNPRSGVKCIYLYLDSSKKETFDYSSDIQTSPFVLPITITIIPLIQGLHTLTIKVIDINDREITQSRAFYVDTLLPGIVGLSVHDISVSESSNGPIEIPVLKTVTNITISVIVSDNRGIETVKVWIMSNTLNNSYIMTPSAGSTPTLGVYSLQINLTNLPYDDYIIKIQVSDLAGNVIIGTYSIELVRQNVLPPFLQGTNLIFFSVGIVTFFIFIILFSVVIRKRVVNLGWKNEIVTVAYILNGIPCVYMINKPQSVKGDLLFGGAMTGIRGVLEEITGEKSKLKLQSVDVGEKKLLICPGKYGDSVLMLNRVKPIHKEKIIDFTIAFEKDYNHLLSSEDLIITNETFSGASILVQEHFGLSDNMELIDECDFEEISLGDEPPVDYSYQTDYQQTQEESADYYQREQPKQQVYPYEPVEPEGKIVEEPIKEVESIEKLINELSAEKQSVFLDLIQSTRTGINAILEREFEETKKANAEILEKLEDLLTDETIPPLLNLVLQSIFTISQELIIAIEKGTKGDDKGFRVAAEKASEIWLNEIGEKW